MNNISLEQIKDVKSKEDYCQLKGNLIHLERYNMFTMAKNLGIYFNATDVSIEDLHVFDAIRTKIDELNEGKKDGSK